MNLQRSRSYYDEFSETYEAERHKGYHRMLDDFEVEVASEYARGGRVLEAGCGTGLILERLANCCHQTVGIDLSGGMLSLAQRRGLDVTQGAVDALPFCDNAFDAVVSFKVLAHVPPIEKTLHELARVTRPGGHLVLEFYNRHSVRHLIKQLKRPTQIGNQYNDEDVFTRFDTLDTIRSYMPPSLSVVDIRGIRVLTPMAQAHDLPVFGGVLRAAERACRDLPGLRRLGGFLVVVMRKAR